MTPNISLTLTIVPLPIRDRKRVVAAPPLLSLFLPEFRYQRAMR